MMPGKRRKQTSKTNPHSDLAVRMEVRVITDTEAMKMGCLLDGQRDYEPTHISSGGFLDGFMIDQLCGHTYIVMDRTENANGHVVLGLAAKTNEGLAALNTLDSCQLEEWMFKEVVATPADVRLQYIGVCCLLARLRKHVPHEDRENIDHALLDCKQFGLIPKLEQMKSGEWFL
jgi:hypothetical protein